MKITSQVTKLIRILVQDPKGVNSDHKWYKIPHT